MQIFCATNKCDSGSKEWYFLLKMNVYQKKKNFATQTKQECNYNGGDYKVGLLYI